MNETYSMPRGSIGNRRRLCISRCRWPKLRWSETSLNMSRSTTDNRDIYYRLCKSEGYRARSAFKLLHLDEEFDLFSSVKTVCDFCAAPGSWSQVLTRKLFPRDGERSKGKIKKIGGRKSQEGLRDNVDSLPGPSRLRELPEDASPVTIEEKKAEQEDIQIVAIDLQPMAPLPHVTTLHADITVPSTVDLVMKNMNGRKADLIVCDGAPEVTGVHDLDAFLHHQLLMAAFALALPLLAPHATLIFKVFLSPMDPKGYVLMSQFRSFFESPDPTNLFGDPSKRPEMAGQPGYDGLGRPGGVWMRKPRSSRAGSAEHFLVCRNFSPSNLPAKIEVDKTATALSLSALKVSFASENVTDQQREEMERRWRQITRYATGDLNVD